MSEQKWAVLGTEAMNGWLVAHPGDVFRWNDGRLECWEVHSRHHTWEEAMQEADRQARTSEITAPRPQRLTTLDWGVPEAQVMIEHTPRYSKINQRDQHIIIHPDHRETLALAFLAHARKGKQ